MDNSRKSGQIGDEMMDLGSVRIADEVIAPLRGSPRWMFPAWSG